MSFWNSTGVIRDCILDNNDATNTVGQNAVGGGIFNWWNCPLSIRNSLITNNTAEATAAGANSSGGGICSGMMATPLTLNNCTISDNQANSTLGNGYGGGIYLAGTATENFTNCIFWNNSASTDGNEINVVSSNGVNLNYCDYDNSANDIADPLSRINPTNCINTNPRFVVGTKGNYYLEHNGVGSGTQDSPCINAGSDTAANLGLDTKTTRVDDITDSGTVDLGYHYTP